MNVMSKLVFLSNFYDLLSIRRRQYIVELIADQIFSE